MAEIIRMPKMSDTMTEGVVAKWHKKVGDTVKSGELMAEIETDKATMDYESFNTGTVLYLGAKEGEAVKIDGVLAIVGKPGEDYKPLLEGGGASTPAKTESKSSSDSSAPAAKPTETATATAIDTSNIKAKIVQMPKMSDTMSEV
jgi:pyruvate dehydrogenase E2 component (dihydrolipoamide acetyltransferase)